MGATAGTALRGLQYFLRAIQFACAALTLAIYSYFLATLHNHSLPIGTSIRAVEGISGAGVAYTILAFLILCCAPGQPFFSFILMILDVCFAAAFIYVAVANKDGASSCNGEVSTAFGKGNADTNVVDNVSASEGFTALPSLRQACKMESAVLAVSIVAVVFFLASTFVNLALARNRKKEQRIGPSPANGYTSGYGKPNKKRFGLFSRLGRKDPQDSTKNDDYLPSHATPDDMRHSLATDQTRVGSGGYSNGYGNLGGGGGGQYQQATTAGEAPDKYQPFVPGTAAATAAAPRYPNASAPYRQDYDDGVYDRVPL
ncbi:hypothetical protein QBC42DRAFT_1723 [Cladorrhinum samala]|uniref:MARVEL domain-containing protein n=1 Tax=Cladorrhinum samala TaxID=585594 RepID=A0AAV9I7R9_9PEZI|nr:hypothetical protein QBC42DRAFT_1723 [Cladorrhinum samala]